MKVICSYCRCDLPDKEPLDDNRVSHGMCTACADHFRRQWMGLSYSQYLDGFASPVFIVDADGRLVASNEAASAMLGKPADQISGALGGQAMECSYARLPGGCGHTEHCPACTIRRAVTAASDSGVTQVSVPVELQRDDGVVRMTLTAQKIDNVIRLELAP
jgi:PAS domain-containing protein